MRINTNTAAMNTYSNLTSANASKSGSLAKLSSGLRINKAGDDAAGLAISEKMKNQISGMTQASRNAQDGISLIQTAEGALSETHSILNRMRDLTVQAGNGTNTDDDKQAIQKEINSLTEEVGRIAKDTQFNTKGLLNGTDGGNTTTIPAVPTVPAVPGTSGTPAAAALDATAIAAKVDAADVDSLVTAYNNNRGSEGADLGVGTATAEDAATAILALTDTDAIAAAATEFTGGQTASATVAVKDFTGTPEVPGTPGTPEVPGTPETTVTTGGKNTFTFQIGANAGENIKIDIANMTSEGLGIDGLDITTEGSTDAALETIDSAIKSVSDERANLGAVQNRLDHTVSNLATTKENLSEANSRITDVDMAEEMMSFTKSNILSQASTSMLAQANQMPQSVLSLLQ